MPSVPSFICSLPLVQAGRKNSQSGVLTCLEHWRWLCHHRLDCLVRLRRRLSLLRRDNALMTNKKAEDCRLRLEGVPVPLIENCPLFWSQKSSSWRGNARRCGKTHRTMRAKIESGPSVCLCVSWLTQFTETVISSTYLTYGTWDFRPSTFSFDWAEVLWWWGPGNYCFYKIFFIYIFYGCIVGDLPVQEKTT